MRISDLVKNSKPPQMQVLLTTHLSLSLKPNCAFHIHLLTDSESCSETHPGDSVVKDVGSSMNSC